MFFIGIIIAVLVLYLTGEAGFFILGIVLFALAISIYFRVKKINKDMLMIKHKLGIDDEDTQNYKLGLEEKASEQRHQAYLKQAEDGRVQVDNEIEEELKQFINESNSVEDTGRKDT